MENCARCKRPIVGDKSVKVHRKDGSPARLCLDCASELRTKRSQNPHPEDVSEPLPAATTAEKKANKSGDKWYQTVAFGFLCIGFAVLVYLQLTRLELGEIASVRVWWPVAVLYRTLGFWGAVSCPAILALLFLGLGIKQLIAEDKV